MFVTKQKRERERIAWCGEDIIFLFFERGEGDEEFILFNEISCSIENSFHFSSGRSFDCVFHFHSFQNKQTLSSLYLITLFHKHFDHFPWNFERVVSWQRNKKSLEEHKKELDVSLSLLLPGIGLWRELPIFCEWAAVVSNCVETGLTCHISVALRK